MATRMRSTPRWARAAVAAGLAWLLVSAPMATGSPERADTSGGAPACGPDDRPERGVQGDVPLADQLSGRARDGYSCGLAVVGHHDLGMRGGNGNMAWSGDCAYIAGDGIAVVDVSDPTAPEVVTTLQGPGSDDTIETLHAVETADRAVLVAGRYGLGFDPGLTGEAPVDVYDVSDCRAPRRTATFHFPQASHNLTLSADATRVWSTLPLQAADITDLERPRYLGNVEEQLRAHGAFQLQYAHEAWPSADGSRLYIGGQMWGDEVSYVLDVSRWPEEPVRVVSRIDGPGHSIRTATVDGRRFLLRSDESVVSPTANACLPSDFTPGGGVAEPRLTEITDETAPRDVGHLQLDINRPEHCPDALASGVNASSHYHDVDDPDDTTFAMVSMWNAGLRLFDVRDPAAPVEVAYFNPGMYDVQLPDGDDGYGAGGTKVIGAMGRGLDVAWAHVRYRPEEGHIWLATLTGGFWVLELEPQVRDALDLPPVRHRRPDGGGPEDGVPPAPPVARARSEFPLVYCTLGRVA